MIAALIWLAFAGLSAADAGLTLRLLRRPGKREANPLLARLFARFGAPPVLLPAKIAIVLALGAALALRLPGARILGLVLDLITGLAVVHNLRQVRS
ncbi:MAG: hypothetical protein JWM33_3749 [Caulobacteraceae bacterium]|nr:hypothetical protein [Caulobacteraceae bacterium]